MNIFEEASRCDLRFESATGLLDVADLWNLPLTRRDGRASLDELAKKYHAELKNAEQTSFVEDTSAADTETQLRFDIILHIIKVKKDEQFESLRRQEAAIKRRKIMELIERKQDEALSAASLDELRSMLDAL